LDNLESLRYPIGRFETPETVSKEDIDQFIEIISEFPDRVQSIIEDLEEKHLLTPYREEGWNGIQVIHHCADSHMNAYIRFKLGLTEDNPTIRPYLESKWAELSDAKSINFEPTLSILIGLHNRWSEMLSSMTTDDFQRTVIHPELEEQLTLAQLLAMYAWHCQHHLGHLRIIQSNYG
jgi:hypothetical protein